MLEQALEAEVADYIARNQEHDEDGRARVVRNGKARPSNGSRLGARGATAADD